MDTQKEARQPRVAFILPCAGSGTRMNSKIPKQFLNIHGKKIIEKTIRAVCKWTRTKDIIIVLNENYQSVTSELKGISARVTVTDKGGKSRHHSIRIGLLKLLAMGYRGDDIVIIHDAVRPFITHEICHNIVNAAIEYGGGSAVRDLVSTVIMPDEDGFYKKMVARHLYKNSYTPQAFQLQYIWKGYTKLSADEMMTHTECVDVAHRGGARVKLIDCDWSLFKITHKCDLFLAQNLHPGRVALVTGGGRGIGKRVAEMLAEHMFRVVVAARTSSEIDAVAANIGGESIVTNVANKESVDELFADINSQFGRLDVMINCAGIMSTASIENTTEEQFESMFQVNVMGGFRCCKSALKIMKSANSGVIVNVGSSSTVGGRVGQTAYAASKSAMQTITECIALEAKEYNVQCYNIVPRRTQTEMRTIMFPDEAPNAALSVDEVAEVIVSTVLRQTPQTTGSTTFVK